ncbi:MAG: lectin like domain-containing protein [Oscillospiraceae bacterium]|nr:lectin like domain-containing protein [Oscillospiraceae bacterium]
MSGKIIMSVAGCLLAAGAVYAAYRVLQIPRPGEEPELSAAEITTAATAETTTTAPQDPYGYVHGTEGYYSLAENGGAPDIKIQEGGTCWVVAASSAMESEHLRSTGSPMKVDPFMLLDSVYRKFKKEGYMLKGEASAVNIGGWGWMLVKSMSNGYNGYILTEANNYNDCDRATIQSELKIRGALNVDVPDDNKKKKICGAYRTMNFPDAEEADYDHSVVIIGWDDHFPKDYFSVPATQDGAWLLQDSRSENYAYYWMSYDTPLKNCLSYSLSGMHGTVCSFDMGKEKKIQVGDETALANVFHYTGTLTDIGTYTSGMNQRLTVEIHDGQLGTLLYAQGAEYRFPGYHTIHLETPQQVSDFTVVVRYAGLAALEGPKWSDAQMDYVVYADEGVSFVEVGSQWYDLTDENIRSILGIDYTPNNACIKAIFNETTGVTS